MANTGTRFASVVPPRKDVPYAKYTNIFLSHQTFFNLKYYLYIYQSTLLTNKNVKVLNVFRHNIIYPQELKLQTHKLICEIDQFMNFNFIDQIYSCECRIKSVWFYFCIIVWNPRSINFPTKGNSSKWLDLNSIYDMHII